MSAAVNDRPHDVIVRVPHLPLTGDLHPLRREFVRLLATGNMVTIALALAAGALVYFWPRPAELPMPPVDFGKEFRFTPPPDPTRGKNDVGYDIPTPKVDEGVFVIAPDDDILKNPVLGERGIGDSGDVPGDDTGPISGSWGGIDTLLTPTPPTPPSTFDGWTEAPVMISCDTPVYPSIVRDAGIDGTVYVRVLIGLNGHVKDAQVVEGSPALREAALASARTAFFKTAMQGTHAVEVWVVIPITFALENGN